MPTLPRLPFVPDPLRRVHVPHDLDAITTVAEETGPERAGMTREDVDEIWQSARTLFRSGVHPALQLCLRRNGHVVIDRAIGHARGNGPGSGDHGPLVAATPDTPFCVYSTSKAVTALAVHLLHERGALSIFDRVADHVPEYATHGKDETTIAHVLSHRAGVPTLPAEVLTLERIDDREFISDAICRAKPMVRPGTSLAYHAVSGGFILGEVVLRATGRTVREILHDELLAPLGFRWTNYGVAPEDVDRVGHAYSTGPKLLPPLSLLAKRVLGASFEGVVEMSNDPRFLTALIPSANIVTTARELSRFFEIFRRGGELDGVRVMRPETLRQALEEQSRLEIDLSLLFPTRFSLGLMLGANVLSLYGRDTDEAFGHLGFINILAWADPERATSVAVITSGKALLYPELRHFLGLVSKITARTPKAPPGERCF